MKTIADLKIGERAFIKAFRQVELSLKLLEMGCLPGEIIEVIRIAPFGDPIAYSIAGYVLSMRRSEAATVLINLSVDNK